MRARPISVISVACLLSCGVALICSILWLSHYPRIASAATGAAHPEQSSEPSPSVRARLQDFGLDLDPFGTIVETSVVETCQATDLFLASNGDFALARDGERLLWGTASFLVQSEDRITADVEIFGVADSYDVGFLEQDQFQIEISKGAASTAAVVAEVQFDYLTVCDVAAVEAHAAFQLDLVQVEPSLPPIRNCKACVCIIDAPGLPTAYTCSVPECTMAAPCTSDEYPDAVGVCAWVDIPDCGSGLLANLFGLAVAGVVGTRLLRRRAD